MLHYMLIHSSESFFSSLAALCDRKRAFTYFCTREIDWFPVCLVKNLIIEHKKNDEVSL
jgi:hypothetical protein